MIAKRITFCEKQYIPALIKGGLTRTETRRSCREASLLQRGSQAGSAGGHAGSVSWRRSEPGSSAEALRSPAPSISGCGDASHGGTPLSLGDALLPGAAVGAEGVRGFRKGSDRSCGLDRPIVSQRNGLDAACSSGKYNTGKTVLPWFLCSSWAPRSKPSPPGSAGAGACWLSTPCRAQGCGHRRRAAQCVLTKVPPEEGHLQQGSDSGRSRERCRNASQERASLVYFSLWRPCSVPPFQLAEEVPCAPRASPDVPWQMLTPAVCCSLSQHIGPCAEQFPISTAARKKRRKLTF